MNQKRAYNAERKRTLSIPNPNLIKKTVYVGLNMTKPVDINLSNNTRNIESIFNKENEVKVLHFFDRRKYRIFDEGEIDSFSKFQSQNEVADLVSDPKLLPIYESKRIVASCTSKLGDLIGTMAKSEIFSIPYIKDKPKVKQPRSSSMNIAEILEKESNFTSEQDIALPIIEQTKKSSTYIERGTELKLDKLRRVSKLFTGVSKMSMKSADTILDFPSTLNRRDESEKDSTGVTNSSRPLTKRNTVSKNKLSCIASFQSKLKASPEVIKEEYHDDAHDHRNFMNGRFNKDDYLRFNCLKASVIRSEKAKPRVYI